jgi:aconitase B
MAEYVAFWTTCLTGQGHFKAKARILQGVSKQQKAGFLRLDFSSIVKRSFF